MQPDLLQQLRDIHLPAEPGWWPPAPGWWLLALILLAAGTLLLTAGWRAWRRRRPIRRARALHDALVTEYRTGQVDLRGYLDGANELLKRLLIHGLGVDAARRANDREWLLILDRALGEPAFSEGPGRALGNDRFAPQPAADAAAVEALVGQLLHRLKPGAMQP